MIRPHGHLLPFTLTRKPTVLHTLNPLCLMTGTHELARYIEHRHSITCRRASAVNKSNKPKTQVGPAPVPDHPPQLRACPRLPSSTDELRRRIWRGGSSSSSSSRLRRWPRMSPASKRTGEGGPPPLGADVRPLARTGRRQPPSLPPRSCIEPKPAWRPQGHSRGHNEPPGAMPPSGDSSPKPGRPPRRHEARAARPYDDSAYRQTGQPPPERIR